jgi:hypothetical protein
MTGDWGVPEKYTFTGLPIRGRYRLSWADRIEDIHRNRQKINPFMRLR